MRPSSIDRPVRVPTSWLLVVLIVALAIVAVEAGLADLRGPAPQPVRVQAPAGPSHASMSGDFLWPIVT